MVGVHRGTDIRTLPDEILIEIFRRIPFNHLHGHVKRVCRAWRDVIIAHFRYPRALLIRGSDSIARIRRSVATCSQRVFVLKITNALDASVVTCLTDHRWPNLRTLIVRSTSLTSCDRALINVADLNRLIDASPRLRFLKIGECLISGNVESLLRRLEARNITKFALLNRYFVTDNVERLYDLERMEVFRVYCHFFNRDEVCTTLDKFLANNERTLTDFALYAQTGTESPNGDDIILTKVASSCGRVVKLTLAGHWNVSCDGLVRVVGALPWLRCLKLDVASSLSSRSVAHFLSDKCARKLRNLKVSWRRRATSNELASFRRCGRHLTKLSLEFWQDDGAFVAEAVATLTKSTASRLRKLKILSTDARLLSVLPSLTTTTRRGSLVSVKFVLAFTRAPASAHKSVEAYLRTIESSAFSYEYWSDETEFTIALTART